MDYDPQKTQTNDRKKSDCHKICKSVPMQMTKKIEIKNPETKLKRTSSMFFAYLIV